MPENDEQQPVIIIVKKHKGHAGGHGGAWKVAYADFVTAMMAFFLVMWILAQNQAIKDNISGYFNDPSGWGKKGGKSIMKGGGEALLKNAAIVKQKRPTEDQAREVLKQASERIKEALNRVPDFATVKDLVEIQLTPEGLRIQLIEASKSKEDSSFFFDLGSSQLSSFGDKILTLIAKELGQLENDVVVEGHTDSHQYLYHDKYSNWELSADRANSARRLMESQGLRPGQVVEIRGYADKQLRLPESPQDARNRRIAIIVLNNNRATNVEQLDMQDMAKRAEQDSVTGSDSSSITQ
jgi:chemotaxis protein MotB